MAIAGGGVEIALESFGADVVDDDVDSLSVRCFQDSIVPLLLGGVVGCGSSELLDAKVAFVIRAGGGVDGGSSVTDRQLLACDRYRRRTGVPQDGLAGLKASDEIHGLDGGDPDLRDGRTLLPAQLIGFVDQHMRADGDILGVATAISKAEDLVALLEAGLALAGQVFDDAAELDAHDFGRVRGYWVQPLALQEVHTVQPERLHFDQRLGVSGFGARGLVVDEQVFNGTLAIFDI